MALGEGWPVQAHAFCPGRAVAVVDHRQHRIVNGDSVGIAILTTAKQERDLTADKHLLDIPAICRV